MIAYHDQCQASVAASDHPRCAVHGVASKAGDGDITMQMGGRAWDAVPVSLSRHPPSPVLTQSALEPTGTPSWHNCCCVRTRKRRTWSPNCDFRGPAAHHRPWKTCTPCPVPPAVLSCASIEVTCSWTLSMCECALRISGRCRQSHASMGQKQGQSNAKYGTGKRQNGGTGGRCGGRYRGLVFGITPTRHISFAVSVLHFSTSTHKSKNGTSTLHPHHAP